MSMSFLPNPRIIARPHVDDERGAPATMPHRGGGNFSDLPKSDDAPAGRLVAGETQPSDMAPTDPRWAAFLLTYYGEIIVAAGIVSFPIWWSPLLKWLVGWSP